MQMNIFVYIETHTKPADKPMSQTQMEQTTTTTTTTADADLPLMPCAFIILLPFQASHFSTIRIID